MQQIFEPYFLRSVVSGTLNAIEKENHSTTLPDA